jgi:hypothetical protein
MELSFDSFNLQFNLTLKGEISHRVTLGTDARGNLTRMDNTLAGIPQRLDSAQNRLQTLYAQQESAKVELEKQFPQESELAEKSARLAELDALLSLDENTDSRDDAERGEDGEEITEAGRPSVLEDLKKRTAQIPPDGRPDREPREEAR